MIIINLILNNKIYMWLDMSLKKRKKWKNKWEEVMYWRKSYAINEWILDKQYKKYWLDEYWDDNYSIWKPISIEELNELLSVIDTFEKNKEWFTDYTLDYIEYTKENLPKIIKELWDDEELIYDASW